MSEFEVEGDYNSQFWSTPKDSHFLMVPRTVAELKTVKRFRMCLLIWSSPKPETLLTELNRFLRGADALIFCLLLS